MTPVSCPVGGTCPPDCDRTQQGCVQTWGPDDEHAEALRLNRTSLAAGARCEGNSPAGVSGSPPESPPAGCTTDPSPKGGEGLEPVSGIRKPPGSRRPDLETPWQVEDFTTISWHDGMPYGVSNSWGVVIAHFDSKDAATAVVNAINRK